MNKLDELRVLVSVDNPDILLVSESWCNSLVCDKELEIEGYIMFRCDRVSNARGGGVLCYAKNHLRPMAFTPSVEIPEMVWCTIADSRGKKLYVGVIYNSRNRNIVDAGNNEKIIDLLHALNGKNIVFMGDLNYSDIDWTTMTASSEISSSFCNALEENFLSQVVTECTRENAILDLLITNDRESIKTIEVLDNFSSSDHSMITSEIAFEVKPRQKEYRSVYEYSKAKVQELRQEMMAMDWNSLLKDNTNTCWKSFKDGLLALEEKFVPKKLVNSDTSQRKLWINNRVRQAVERRQKLYKKYKNEKHPAYCKAKITAAKVVKKAKKEYEQKLAQNIKIDKKSFFAYVRSKKKSAVTVGPLVDGHGNLCDHPQQMVEIFNKEFCSVFSEEDDTEEPFIPAEVTETIVVDDSAISQEEVRQKLLKLRSDKAPGPDKISPRFLKLLEDCAVKPLTLLFNRSFEESVVPEDWRMANVCPIYKKGSRSQPLNYRPVSLTSQLVKIMESILRDRIVAHLEGNDLINESQHGFRSKKSCLTNLVEFLCFVTDSIDEGIPVDTIFLDFAKAFDKVPHKRLISKMKSLGISGKILDWVRSWLKDRMQRVCVREECSAWRRVTSGVPQGSVLGPVLFIIYVNDIDKNLLNRLLKFADDTKLLGRARNKADYEAIQHDLDKLAQWSERWLMDFNVDKCKVMHFMPRNCTTTEKYVLNGRILESSNVEKDLGVVISSTLKSSAHCQSVYNKAIAMLGLINRTIEYKDKTTMLNLYKALVRPIVEYCSAAWSPHYLKDKKLIERIQHRFTRMIPSLKGLLYDKRLKALGIWTLEERRNRADLIEVYKIFSGSTNLKPEDLFELNSTQKTRGHTRKIYKKRCNLDLRKYFFSERVINFWNELSQDCIDASSINVFKNKLSELRKHKMGFFFDR